MLSQTIVSKVTLDSTRKQSSCSRRKRKQFNRDTRACEDFQRLFMCLLSTQYKQKVKIFLCRARLQQGKSKTKTKGYGNEGRNRNVKHMIFMYEMNADKTVTYFYVAPISFRSHIQRRQSKRRRKMWKVYFVFNMLLRFYLCCVPSYWQEWKKEYKTTS